METPWRHWSPTELGKARPGGEAAQRAELTWQRLQHPAFLAPQIFDNVDADDWPGDWVARTLHANVLLARTLGRDSAATEEIIRQIPEHVNDCGYFGEPIDPESLTEQQLGSPHGWLLRGLLEYHAWTGDPAPLAIADDVIREIGVPLTAWWNSYPLTLESREAGEGEMVGQSAWRSGRWVMSSDIGNQFMILDGLTQAWAENPTPELRASIDAGIARFLAMDLAAATTQTHATLTTLRAILRLHALTGDAALLDAAVERYKLYREHGMTETYGNLNWFGRPDTWTEPCAIIDSFIVALELWRRLEDPAYLEDAHLIWFNGVGRAQRGNGGYGCDNCAGYDEPFVRMKMIYEAFFCCTMRGAEGHAELARSAFHVRDGEIAVTFPIDVDAELGLGDGRLRVRETTGYPADGWLQIEVLETDLARSVTWRFFSPRWLEDVTLTVAGLEIAHRRVNGFLVADLWLQVGDVVRVDGRLATWRRGRLNPLNLDGYSSYFCGPLQLGHLGEEEVVLPESFELEIADDSRFRVTDTDILLGRIDDAVHFPPAIEVMTGERGDYLGNGERLISDVGGLPRQVLFRSPVR